MFAVVLAGYAAAILILTSQRVRLTRGALPIGTGTLAVLAMYASAPFQGWSSVGAACFVIFGLPALTGFVVARLAAPDTGSGISPTGQGCVAGLCATGTTALLPVGLGAALGELSRGTGNPSGEPMPSPLEEPPHEYGRLLPAARPDEAYLTTLRNWRRSATA
jgi:hypothetical protein